MRTGIDKATSTPGKTSSTIPRIHIDQCSAVLTLATTDCPMLGPLTPGKLEQDPAVHVLDCLHPGDTG